MEPNSPKKIQFAVPLFQSQIDPEAAEQIRKRRPTPASLVIMNEHSPPEIDEKRKNNSQGEACFKTKLGLFYPGTKRTAPEALSILLCHRTPPLSKESRVCTLLLPSKGLNI
ncbi:protein phosphatase 1 regulatory subunit 1C isoform X4 [Mauremys reevesii]|uniref:protein phosphatase 1 regulatory subunit 1C isoform X4 n=1 Tax=Mauremys reevesii TaxID=260615 RepID=UPI001940004E|nr:protein phosphatase 1 regulatory subunit 1C isoform X4 [Mauremys reevesii]